MAIYKADRNQTVFFYESGTYASTSGAAQWVGQVQDAPVDEELNRIRQRYQGTDMEPTGYCILNSISMSSGLTVVGPESVVCFFIV